MAVQKFLHTGPGVWRDAHALVGDNASGKSKGIGGEGGGFIERQRWFSFSAMFLLPHYLCLPKLPYPVPSRPRNDRFAACAYGSGAGDGRVVCARVYNNANVLLHW